MSNTYSHAICQDGVVAAAESATSQGDELGGSAQEIGKVIGTITEISEQVNLLALNATIEAARAEELDRLVGMFKVQASN